MSKTAYIAFRAGNLEPELKARGDSPGLTAKRDLGRYYQLLRDEASLKSGARRADTAQWRAKWL